MLMSMMSAPSASAIRAPSAIQCVSQPASWTTCGPIPVASQRNRDIRWPLASSSLAVISETTRPAPNSAASRRTGESVTPDIGARKTGVATSISPIFNGLEPDTAEPVTGVSLSWQRLIAPAMTYLAHNSCAVKRHAYSLDSSGNLSSAVQQNAVSHNPGKPLFLRACRARGMRQSPHPRLSSSPNEYLSPMAKSQRTAVVLVAAGRGLRAGAGGPKQYREIGGVPVIYRAMEAFSRHADVFAVQPVVNPDDSAMFTAAVAGLSHEAPVNGGATRQASVLAGLEALARHKPDIVLIHDAARPFVSEGVDRKSVV